MCICKNMFLWSDDVNLVPSDFGLSLDAILGYQIVPTNSLQSQPLIIKISLAMTIIFMIIGLLNGILSLITFKNKSDS